MQADDGVGLLARGEERIPDPGVQAGQPALGGQLGEAHGLEAARGVAAYLLGRQLRVGQPRQLQRDDPVGVRAGPHLEVPVVPGPQHRETELGVVALPEHRAREPGDQRREVQRRPDAGEVHVGDARIDIPTAAPHFVEPGGLHAPFLFGPPDHRVEPDVRILAVLVAPHLAPSSVSTIFGARSASAAGRRPSNMSGGSMTWSSTEIRMCCRSRGVGSGSSAIPDDYRRFSSDCQCYLCKNSNYRFRRSTSASAPGCNSRDPNAGRLGPDGPLVDFWSVPSNHRLDWYPARGGAPGRGELSRSRRAA